MVVPFEAGGVFLHKGVGQGLASSGGKNGCVVGEQRNFCSGMGGEVMEKVVEEGGDRTLPCGTPAGMVCVEETAFCTLTANVRSHRKLWTILIRKVGKLVWIILMMSALCQTESKADSMSRERKEVIFRLFMDCVMWWIVLWSCIVVLRPLRNPYWKDGIMLEESRWPSIRLRMTRSRIFEM